MGHKPNPLFYVGCRAVEDGLGAAVYQHNHAGFQIAAAEQLDDLLVEPASFDQIINVLPGHPPAKGAPHQLGGNLELPRRDLGPVKPGLEYGLSGSANFAYWWFPVAGYLNKLFFR